MQRLDRLSQNADRDSGDEFERLRDRQKVEDFEPMSKIPSIIVWHWRFRTGCRKCDSDSGGHPAFVQWGDENAIDHRPPGGWVLAGDLVL